MKQVVKNDNKEVHNISIMVKTLYSYKQPEKVILHGKLTGVVTDAGISQPNQAASVILNQKASKLFKNCVS